ncbi:MAG TPA: oxidoreductase [Naasia sp.]
MNALDRLTGRLPMYRLVTLALLVLLAASLLLSATGQLFYSPLAILASAAVTTGVCWGATRLLGIAFRVRPHDESAVITGLILFFLFLPTLDPAGLSVLAFAGAVAAASKFLLAWRGRHLFNPAAVAAVIVGLTGLGASGWWVATPPLAPLVAVLGLLILQRTRLLGVGLVFTVVATLLIAGLLTGFGVAPLPALGSALGSYPILFLAAFLLPEPLTLPPLRWQRIVVASIMAGAFALPLAVDFRVGTFGLSSELAVVLGNLVALVLARPVGARLRFDGRREVAPGTEEFSFRADREVPMRPGQYVELDLPHAGPDRRGTRRHLTAVGAREGHVRGAVRLPETGSSFKRALAALEPGDPVRLTSVAGDFLLPWNQATPVLLVAGGIGVTPFVAQLEGDAERGVERRVAVVYRAPSLEAAAYLDRLAALADSVTLVTPTPPEPMPRRVHCAADLAEALAEIEDRGKRTAYVSGSPSFVARARAELRKAGVRRIRTDRFSGY